MSSEPPHEESTTSDNTEMRIDPARAKVLVENISQVIQRIDAVRGSRQVRLIAVSKLKPASDILSLHQSSSQKTTHFGENYSQELQTKASLLPRSIHWHMIGALQTNKCKPLAETVPNLFCVSSVDTAKKADALEKGRATCVERENIPLGGKDSQEGKLRVLVQVNTSGEDSKSGVSPGTEAVDLCRHVREKCPHLHLAGLMTIGAIARSQEAATEEGRNEDFNKLREVRDEVAKELGLKEEELELSMGMSADFEAAVRQGSDEVRVGTGIFGERPKRSEAVIEG
ncbi:YgS family pyridoxal phosphate enzyme like protein [Zymoseptoria brevis]|uniref:Pyridoxal phosphate homeostasis protein n=1 Tax=Zymoseptoria brevis TaxID=1047168 RepID=A0A0F4GAS5_9PEZI|nr:YgS family pyridoxal phosphate enzyme like protein [Zymoseptoria brevis]